MKSDQAELLDIVEHSDIPVNLKNILNKTFKTLANRNDSVLHEIRDHVLRENDNLKMKWNDRWSIATILVSEKNFADVNGFRKLLRNSDPDENLLSDLKYINLVDNYFLDCSYEDALAICSDEYTDDYPYVGNIDMHGQKISFHYRLAHDFRYVNLEQMLYQIADIYQIVKPIIFSPYARRAVKIQIPKENSDVADFLRDQNLDLTPYCLDQNHLSGKFLADSQLMWNLRTESVTLPEYKIADDKDQSYFAPYGDREIYRYEFKNINDQAFICPDEIDFSKIIAAEKNLDRQQITLIARDRLTSPCKLVQIIRSDIKNSLQVFKNSTSDSIFSKERLRTEGDIEFVLHGLSMPTHGFICKFDGVSRIEKNDRKICRRYSRDLSYRTSIAREQSLYGNRRGLPFCYIKFSGDEKFLDDYANYVLSFLENRYPDFQWIGVI